MCKRYFLKCMYMLVYMRVSFVLLELFSTITIAVPEQENEEVKLAYQKLQALVSFINFAKLMDSNEMIGVITCFYYILHVDMFMMMSLHILRSRRGGRGDPSIPWAPPPSSVNIVHVVHTCLSPCSSVLL